MLLLRTDKLPEGEKWRYEIKLDGFRAIAFKMGGGVHLRSRNDKDFNSKYPAIVKALSAMPDETVKQATDNIEAKEYWVREYAIDPAESKDSVPLGEIAELPIEALLE